MFLNNLYGGMDEPEIKIIDVFMCKLRKKLAKVSNGKDYIETVRGRGYVLREPSVDEARISVQSNQEVVISGLWVMRGPATMRTAQRA